MSMKKNKKSTTEPHSETEAGKLRVLQVAKWCSPSVGGIERVVEDISDGLKQRSEMTLLVCANGRKTEKETRPDGVRVVRAGKIGKISSMPVSFKYLHWFRKLSVNADIIQFHAPFPLSDLAWFLFHRKNTVTAVWWHSDVVRQKKLMILYKPLMKWFLRHVDKIYVASEAIVNQSAYLGKFRDNVEVIPFGLNEKEYTSAPAAPILTDALTDKNNKKILFVGRLVYYKGIDVLLEAFDGIEDSELFIIGRGEDGIEETLKEIAGRLTNADRVHFLGEVDEESLKAAYRDCDIFVLPSVSRAECFGLVQLEAMVYGKPVINTMLDTAVPEVSRDGESGITVTPSNVEELHSAMDKLCHDDALRKKYGDEARERIHRYFSLKVMSDGLFSSYERLYSEKHKN